MLLDAGRTDNKNVDLPVRCGTCGVTFYGDLIVPAGATASPLAESGSLSETPSNVAARCPLCRSEQDEESLDLSRQILAVLRELQAEQADLRGIAASMRELIAERADEAKVDEELADRHLNGLRRLLPHGQANVLAFCALVVAIATLAESILVSLPMVSTQSHSAETGNGRYLSIGQVDVGRRTQAPVRLQGTFQAVEGSRPWALRFDRHSRGGTSRARRRHAPIFDFEAHRCRRAGENWSCEIGPPKSFRVVEWHLAVVLLPVSFNAGPAEIRSPETRYESWLGQPMADAVALVSFKREWDDEGNSSWKATEPRTESLGQQGIGDFLFQQLSIDD